MIQKSIDYLASPAALQSIRINTYWPKWDSPWWHMMLLHELGQTQLIPRTAIDVMLDEIAARSVPFFALPGDPLPEGADPVLDTQCHCGLGNMYRLLRAAGAPVDEKLPWARPWFVKYQLPDGGYNCDEQAYLDPERPSSMVATIAVAEALLSCGVTELKAPELAALDRCAAFLIDRGLTRGSATRSNAEERLDEPDWLLPAFPRFYFYDVLRGLSFLLRWAEARAKTLPAEIIEPVVRALREKFPDGKVRPLRQSIEGVGTRLILESGELLRQPHALLFELLKQVSGPEAVSPALSLQWQEALARIQGH